MAGDLNSNLVDPEVTPQSEAISDKLASARLEDMGLHFLPQCKPWLQDRCTWSMRRYGQEFWSWMDYILITDCRLFQDVEVRDPQHNLDHYIVLGCLRGDPGKELMNYLHKAHRLPLWPIY